MMYKVKLFIFINAVLFVTCLITNAQDTIYLDGKGEGRIFEGICGVNASGGVGRLLINYQATADYIVNYVKGAKAVHNLDIDYVGLWNETKTCNEMFKKLRKTLDANGLQKVTIIGDDQVRNWSIVDAGNSEQLVKDIRLWTPRKRPTMAFISLSNWVTSLKPVNDALKELGPEYIAVTPEQLADLFWKSKKK